MISALSFAFRSLVRTPGFTVLAVLTLALGIGMNTAMFSVLNGFLLRPLSYPHSDRLFRLQETRPQQQFGNLSPANYFDVAAGTANTADFAVYRYWAFTLTEPGLPADVPNAVRVSANYFPLLGQGLALGRGFHPDEGEAGRDSVIVISHEYWRSHFSSDPQIIGRKVRLDGAPTEIIGVLADTSDTVRLLGTVGIFRPFVWNNQERATRTDRSLGVIGRYRDGVTVAQANAQFETIGRQLASDHPLDNANLSLTTRSLQSTTLGGNARTMTWLLLGLSGFVLLIACANLANLLLARALGRAREFSVRGALGASRAQLIKPILVECLVLAVLGGIAAVLVSLFTTEWLAGQFGTPDNPADFSLDGRVLAFTIGTSLVTALLFGVAPAWWAARLDLNGAMKGGARGSTGTRAQQGYRQALIVTQFALALVLLAGAGFFVQGLGRLMVNRAGWNPDPVISGVVNLASGKYNAAEPIIGFHQELRQRLLALPGIANATVAFEIPLYTPPAQRNYLVQGREPPAVGRELSAFTNAVSASFFDTVGTRLVRGRLIDDTDQLTSRPVVVINESMARSLFPSGDALGQQLGLAGQDNPCWAEIVGIVEDTRPLEISPTPVRFQVYKPFPQEAWQYVTIAVRAQNPSMAAALVEPIRKVVASLDPDQPVIRLMTASQRISENLSIWSTINRLLILFAALGLMLASLGIYGVITRIVTQRTGEIGIRMALGAQVHDIVRLVLGSGLRMSLAGSAVGIVGAFFLAQFLNKTMPAFGGESPLPIFVAGGLLTLVALLACWLPTRRATKIDPTVALRAE